MKFIKPSPSALLTLALALFLLSVCVLPMITASADGGNNNDKKTAYSYKVGGVNAYPKTGFVTIFTPEYGETCGGKESYSALEVTVSGGRVLSVGGLDNAIPKDGFVAMIRGSALKDEINSLGLAAGDRVIYDGAGGEILFIGKNYNPYYENIINFDRYNSTRTENTIIIYNSGETTKTNIWGTEVVVDSDGFVSEIGGNNNAIPTGGFVISAVGAGRMAELTNAASPGLEVIVDAAEKTITFAFSPQSVVGYMKVGYENAAQRLEEAKESFEVLDYNRAFAVLGEMEDCLSRARGGVSAGDIGLSLENRYEFESLLREFLVLSVETPAVEQRAMWIRPTNSETRQKVNETVKQIYEAGYNAVCIELLFNSVTIFPIDSNEYLFSQDPALSSFDVLAAYIDECHRYGIEVHGWMTCYRVSHAGTTYPDLAVSAKKPEWLNISKKGVPEVGSTGGYFLNPAYPEVNEFLLKFYRYILTSYDLDGFQLDYIRYPFAVGEDFGYDEQTREMFREEFGTDPMDLSKNSALWGDWCLFRAAFVTDFVRQIREMVDEIRPDIYLSADVAPDYNDVYEKYMQEAAKWLEEGLVDIVFPMAYGTNIVPLYASYSVEAAGETAYTYVGLGDYGEDILWREIIETRKSGGEGFAFFSWHQYVAGEYFDKIKQILAKPALSPSYNAKAALSAQLDFLLSRLDAAETIKKGGTEDLEFLIDTVNEIKTRLKSGEATPGGMEIRDIISAALTQAGQSGAEQPLKDVVLGDLKKALKIINLSKDGEKLSYRESHPLPPLYNGEESKEPDESQTEFSSGEELKKDTENDKLKKALAYGAAGLVLAAGVAAGFAIRKYFKKKEGKN